MNDLKVKCFLAAAESLNFTKDAESMFVSQSVFSRQISAMENELEKKLFYRGNKSVLLTPVGEIIFAGLKDLSWRYKSMLENADAVHKGFRAF